MENTLLCMIILLQVSITVFNFCFAEPYYTIIHVISQIAVLYILKTNIDKKQKLIASKSMKEPKPDITFMTKEEYKAYCIKNHRTMWQWIADETLRQKRCVSKTEALDHFGWHDIHCDCWCCEHKHKLDKVCSCACPIRFDGEFNTFGLCLDRNSSYNKWMISCNWHDYISASKYAYTIANLPEREVDNYEETY